MHLGLVTFGLIPDPGLVETILERISLESHLTPIKVNMSPNVDYRWQISRETALVLTVFGGQQAMTDLSLALAHSPQRPAMTP